MRDPTRHTRPVMTMLERLAKYPDLKILCVNHGMARYIGKSRPRLGRRCAVSSATVGLAFRAGLLVRGEEPRQFDYTLSDKGRATVELQIN